MASRFCCGGGLALETGFAQSSCSVGCPREPVRSWGLKRKVRRLEGSCDGRKWSDGKIAKPVRKREGRYLYCYIGAFKRRGAAIPETSVLNPKAAISGLRRQHSRVQRYRIGC